MSTPVPTPTPTPAAPIPPVAPTEPEGAKPDEPLGEAGIAALKSEREARAAAEKQAKDALAKVKEFEDAQKSDAEKAAERIAEIERENAELKTAQTRAEVAATKGVPISLVAGPASNSPEDIAKFADELIAFKGEAQPQRLHVPGITRSPSGDKDISPERQFLREMFAGQ